MTIVIVTIGGGGEVADTLSFGYLRAMKTGNTLGQLVERQGRAEVERQIVERAQQDAVFAANLAKRPRQTLEDFLGVQIPSRSRSTRSSRTRGRSP